MRYLSSRWDSSRHLGGNRIGLRKRLNSWRLEFEESMRHISHAKCGVSLGSLAAVPILLAIVIVAGCGGNNVGVGMTSSTSSTSSTTPPQTLASSTSTAPSSSTTSWTSTSGAPADPAVDWADPEAVGRDFFDAWRAGDGSRMRLLASEEEFLGWVLEVSLPDEPVECRSIDSETVQCDVTVSATGELYYALLRQFGDKWLVDWASVSSVNEGGCC
jgi:hypothetical protein